MENRVTPRWLDISLDSERILKPIPHECVECKPFPFKLPLAGMEDVGCVHAVAGLFLQDYIFLLCLAVRMAYLQACSLALLIEMLFNTIGLSVSSASPSYDDCDGPVKIEHQSNVMQGVCFSTA